jgi:murein DD-endopeptidase MepM/ murein hydrolase activator NlpD
MAGPLGGVMSQLSASQSQQIVRAQQVSRAAARRVDARTSDPGKPAKPGGYTIGLRGRQIRFGPVAFWIAVGSVVIMAGWSAVTATYFAFRDDVLKNLMAHQAEQQYGYEDRIAELRDQIDRTASRQLLDREQFEQKLNDLLRREATLESRATALSGLGDPTTTGSIRPAPRTGDSVITQPRLERGSLLEPAHQPAAAAAKPADVAASLGRIEASLDGMERRQFAALAQTAEHYEGEARNVRGALAALGLKLDTAPRGSGGPFVPVKLPPESQGFEQALIRASIARAEASRLDAELVSVPVRVPVTGEIDITSPFGVRVDPFLHVAAMHTGIDFRGEYGEPVHATAAGTVTNAGWSGGYGKMVEIDHGNGLATRYGHLSEIDVKVGQSVRSGEVVGRLGSTGRSTGPHLHYETRIEGEAVDPQKFLGAGAKLFGGQQQARWAGRNEIQD